MSKEFIDFRWTCWSDFVGSTLSSNIENAISDISKSYNDYLDTVKSAEDVMSSKITYISKKNLINSLEVKSNV